MTTNAQKLANRDIRSRQEVRRGTVLTDLHTVAYDPSTLSATVFVVDVDIGATRPIRDVIVKSSSGTGGRAYASAGRAVEIQRNQGGRWFVIGAGDRIRNVGEVQDFDEATESFDAAVSAGFTSARRTYDFYGTNGTYGQAGYGHAVIVDTNGDEVTI